MPYSWIIDWILELNCKDNDKENSRGLPKRFSKWIYPGNYLVTEIKNIENLFKTNERQSKNV